MTAARARKGAALERSGSMTVSSAVTGPGATRQRLGSASSTSTPWRRSSETVISMCGIDGTGLPSCSRSTPLSYLRAGQQQRRDELRGRRGVDDDLAAGHRARSADHERQGAATLVVDRDAEATQRGQHLADRAGAHVRVAVEGHRPARQGGDRRHEPQHGPGQPAVDVGVAVEHAWRHGPVVTGGVHVRRRGTSGPPPSATCRATAGPGVRRSGRRPARPAPGRGS